MSRAPLPGVKSPETEGSVQPGAVTQDGSEGFTPQYSGHAKANHSHTSSFNAGPPDYTMPGYASSKETAQPEDTLVPADNL